MWPRRAAIGIPGWVPSGTLSGCNWDPIGESIGTHGFSRCTPGWPWGDPWAPPRGPSGTLGDPWAHQGTQGLFFVSPQEFLRGGDPNAVPPFRAGQSLRGRRRCRFVLCYVPDSTYIHLSERSRWI